MNYKVIKYRCGCKYILITDKEKRIFKTGKCPEHWENQETVILWCSDCGVKIKAIPQAGHHQARCYQCAKQYQLEVNRKNWKTKYAGRYKQCGVIRYLTKEPENIKAKRIINEIFAEIRRKFMPVWEGI